MKLSIPHIDAFNKLKFIGCWKRTINKSAADRMNKQHMTVFLISNIAGRAFNFVGSSKEKPYDFTMPCAWQVYVPVAYITSHKIY